MNSLYKQTLQSFAVLVFLIPLYRVKSEEIPQESPENVQCQEAIALVRQGVRLGDSSTKEASFYKKAIKKCPKLSEAHYNHGLLMYNLKKFPEAKESFIKAIDIKNSSLFKLGLAQTHYQLGNNDDALRLYDEILLVTESKSTSRNALIGKSIVFTKIGKITDALSLLNKENERLKGKDEQNADILYNLGVLYEKHEDKAGAASLYEEALRLEPSHFDSLLQSAILFKKDQKYPSSISRLLRAQSVRGDVSLVHELLGVLYKEIGDFERSEMSFQKALALAPGSTEVSINLAIVYLAKKQEQLAEDLLKKITNEEDDEDGDLQLKAQAYAVLGIVQNRLGKSENAKRSIQKSYYLDSENDLAIEYKKILNIE